MPSRKKFSQGVQFSSTFYSNNGANMLVWYFWRNMDQRFTSPKEYTKPWLIVNVTASQQWNIITSNATLLFINAPTQPKVSFIAEQIFLVKIFNYFFFYCILGVMFPLYTYIYIPTYTYFILILFCTLPSKSLSGRVTVTLKSLTMTTSSG